MPKQIVRPQGLPDPGPARAYSHGVRVGNLLYLAGQTGTDAQPQPGSAASRRRRGAPSRACS